jgi:chaperone modulatory protein CbpM
MRKRPSFAATGIDHMRLQAWIEAGWLSPDTEVPNWRELTETDLARAQLICDLQDDLGVNDEGIEVILGLLDQLYGMRQAMRTLMERLREPSP